MAWISYSNRTGPQPDSILTTTVNGSILDLSLIL